VPLPYGIAKAKLTSLPRLTSKPVHNGGHEKGQYHLHFSLNVNGESWDTAVKVGMDNEAGRLKYKIVEGFQNPVAATLRAASGAVDLTGQAALPALDFLRNGILEGTGPWLGSVGALVQAANAPRFILPGTVKKDGGLAPQMLCRRSPNRSLR
jgi:hypothetical protein